VDEAAVLEQSLILVEAVKEEWMVARESGDALYRDPEIVSGNVAIPAGPAVAPERLRVSTPSANEEASSQGGMVVDRVEASGEEALALPLQRSGAARDQRGREQKRYGQIQPHDLPLLKAAVGGQDSAHPPSRGRVGWPA
jgi:hypothetical protein